MLVLSREVDEKIMIGDNIEITVISIDRGQVKLGVHAPREILVLREELLDRTKDNPPFRLTTKDGRSN